MSVAAKAVEGEARVAGRSRLLDRLGDSGLVVAIVFAGALLPVVAINRLISTDGQQQ